MRKGRGNGKEKWDARYAWGRWQKGKKGKRRRRKPRGQMMMRMRMGRQEGVGERQGTWRKEDWGLGGWMGRGGASIIGKMEKGRVNAVGAGVSPFWWAKGRRGLVRACGGSVAGQAVGVLAPV